MTDDEEGVGLLHRLAPSAATCAGTDQPAPVLIMAFGGDTATVFSHMSRFVRHEDLSKAWL